MMDFFFDYLHLHASILYLKVDNKGNITSVNAFASKILGDEIVGKNLKEIFIDFHKQPDLEKAFVSQQVLMYNLNTIAEMPETFYFWFYRENGVIHILGESNHEEYDLMRAQLMEINNDLSNSTRELHKKNAELQKLNDLKNHFLNAAAHDLRNPIGNIIRLSDFLLSELKEKLNTQQMQFLNLIRSLSDFGMKLLNDLLDLARIESGKLLLKKEPTQLVGLLKESIRLNQFSCESKGINIHLEVFEEIEDIEIDTGSIRQVMDNLLSNAIKFSRTGSSITVGLLSNESFVTVFVKDEGRGMTEEERAEIFKPFSRSAKAEDSGLKGTGLGLSIVEKIVSSHQGKIWVKSEIRQGTTIYFSLPKDHIPENHGQTPA